MLRGVCRRSRSVLRPPVSRKEKAEAGQRFGDSEPAPAPNGRGHHMGNHPRAAKVPDHGVVPVPYGLSAQRACACAQPADGPPRSWQAAALDAPRLFALVVAEVEVPDEVYHAALALPDCDGDPADTDNAEADRGEGAGVEEQPVQGDGQPGEVVAWGLSFSQRAVVFLHNPLTGRDDVGIFASPERARRFYSLFGELHLTYV